MTLWDMDGIPHPFFQKGWDTRMRVQHRSPISGQSPRLASRGPAKLAL
jgi:hypothetical protein